jgi:hypothetical protein
MHTGKTGLGLAPGLALALALALALGLGEMLGLGDGSLHFPFKFTRPSTHPGIPTSAWYFAVHRLQV